MDPHPYGLLSLAPSVVAIVLAIATRHVILSMLAGIFVGALITNGANPIGAVGDTLELHLWKSLTQEERLRVFAFTLMMGAMIGVIQRAGGMRGLVDLVSPWARNRRRGQITTWILGMLVFFDDYANTVLLGNTLQPLSDRLKISREKLAYLVDSTAAPVAGLAVISTWVAGEIGFVQEGLKSVGAQDASAFRLFIESIPYRFYVLWALAFVFLVGFFQRDFGPMLKAERLALGSKSNARTNNVDDPTQTKSAGWWNAVIPIALTVVAVLWLLIYTGRESLHSEGAAEGATLWQIFGAADSYFALLWGSFSGMAISILMTMVQRLLSWQEITESIGAGARLMLPALAVLWLASALSTMTGNNLVESKPIDETDPNYPAKAYRLYTGEYLAGMITGGEGDPSGPIAAWLPTIVFVLAAGISFSTGTSWGTMAILLPIAIPLVYGAIGEAGSDAWQSDPILIGAVGSVLAGSIFGDHCSPISDTTVLSSQACGCEHTAHVWTQLPYALTVGVISIVFGTLPIGFGISVWLTLPAGLIALIVFLLLVGRPTRDASDAEKGGFRDASRLASYD